MEISEAKSREVLLVGLKGRLDAASSGAVEKRLLELIQDGEKWIVLDLGQLDYISSIGLRVFMVTAKRLKTVKGGVVVCSLQSSIEQVFKISGFGRIFSIFPDRDAALTELTAASSSAAEASPASPAPKEPRSDSASAKAAEKRPAPRKKKFW